MATYNNLVTEEFVKESTDRTRLTIKLIAYDGDNMVTYTGDGEYLNHNDATWKSKTRIDEVYYDFDECTPLVSRSFTYIIPEDQQTSIVQSFTHPHNHEEQLEYQAKRIVWEENYRALEVYSNTYTDLMSAVSNL